ncbi:TMhelix containing protein [Vibrio phage 1.238.A._10N.261.52.F10]|uniref:TMhelix containing protein n=2 Tax=Pariacacavirus TaxID=2948856 RepID=A0A2I7RUF8_9CAUD|nr:TMhelix containing protein [Vibrio phage 1.238.A._10N.261.52.F10]YP_010093488.1 TMhelix containing protein [Vibrio phage 1.245.O._10N.261.54.C7]AUR97290.1 TMhelix containing protein [Vibrio phage 1.238.A._10N.261.52.F10]AUR97384.1 TMhelix containing protein [Vibrio phage 1.238.B._10N.261.52.F10]AUR97958.1 TMhelix containing protein [Vibrio phage 1.245.O._10N.261.54.C7]
MWFRKLMVILLGLLVFPIVLLIFAIPWVGISIAVIYVLGYCYLDDKKRQKEKGS